MARQRHNSATTEQFISPYSIIACTLEILNRTYSANAIRFSVNSTNPPEPDTASILIEVLLRENILDTYLKNSTQYFYDTKLSINLTIRDFILDLCFSFLPEIKSCNSYYLKQVLLDHLYLLDIIPLDHNSCIVYTTTNIPINILGVWQQYLDLHNCNLHDLPQNSYMTILSKSQLGLRFDQILDEED